MQKFIVVSLNRSYLISFCNRKNMDGGYRHIGYRRTSCGATIISWKLGIEIKQM